MELLLNLLRVEDYRTFLRIKSLPRYEFVGRVARFPDEYAEAVGAGVPLLPRVGYTPSPWQFDYQKDISRLAIRKRKFAVFMDCGLGKTAILLEYARWAAEMLPPGQAVLIVSPLMVVRQTLAEAAKFYGDDLNIQHVRAAELPAWTENRYGAGRIGITNYEAITDKVKQGNLGALILDESSMLKSHYGKWGQRLIRLGRGLDYKLCLTGTPAPNDRIEYANHAVFLDQFPTVNSFLGRYFVNRGQTDNRWELKPHALRPFYRALSHWCIFVTNPGTYGWRDNAEGIPPINVHIHDVPLTAAQRKQVASAGGDMFGTPGGITSRAKLSQLAKGRSGGKKIATRKPEYIRKLVDGWPDESTLIWCLFNKEQDTMEEQFPNAASLRGETPEEDRHRLIGEFQRGERRVMISKPKILGFGLNLQVCTRQVFSGLQDSYESYYQAVKRSNRIGSTRPLQVHIPVTEIERPMIETVLAKAKRVQADAEEQEQIFKENCHAFAR